MAQYSSQLIQHSGIVAGVCKDIGLAEKIDALIPENKRDVAERTIRANLREKGIQIWDQKNRPTSNPTIRWIFMIFEDVLLISDHEKKRTQPTNLREEHIRVLQALGETYEKIYFL